jgi:hypothetical protein
MAARWFVLILSLINPFFNYILDALPFGGDSMTTVTDRYEILFRPAGYAFAIWGLIYLSFIIYAIYQLMPSQRHSKLYDKVAPAFIISNLFGMAWQLAFRNDQIAGSLAIIVIMLVTAIIQYALTRRAVLDERATSWISIPFGLYMAWLSVATIANIGIWLADIDWRGGGVSEELWTNVMLVVALLLTVILSRLFRDLSMPLVATWAIFAIYVSNKNVETGVANIALIAGLAGLAWCIGFCIWGYSHRRAIS